MAENWNKAYGVTFVPVTDGGPENKTFHAATPGGKFEATLSAEAYERLGPFVLGTEYYVDFIRVEPVGAIDQRTPGTPGVISG